MFIFIKELFNIYRPNKTVIKECFRALLEQLYRSHLSVVSAAADCLITFAQNFSMWSDNEVVNYLLMIVIDFFNYHTTYVLSFIDLCNDSSRSFC